MSGDYPMRPRDRATGMIIGFIVGALLLGSIGVWTISQYVEVFRSEVAELNRRAALAATRYDAKMALLDGADVAAIKDITSLRERVAAIEAKLPLQVPAIDQMLRQEQHLSAQDGRMNSIETRQGQTDSQVRAVCSELRAISAVSAKRAGC